MKQTVKLIAEQIVRIRKCIRLRIADQRIPYIQSVLLMLDELLLTQIIDRRTKDSVFNSFGRVAVN